jgi:hypothetical protein
MRWSGFSSNRPNEPIRNARCENCFMSARNKKKPCAYRAIAAATSGAKAIMARRDQTRISALYLVLSITSKRFPDM